MDAGHIYSILTGVAIGLIVVFILGLIGNWFVCKIERKNEERRKSKK